MANQKLTVLTEDSGPLGSDLGYVVDGATNSRKRYLPDYNLLPEGQVINGKFQVTVASNNITVALKTKSGGNPSTSDPVTVWINGSYRRCTAALSVTKAAGTNWFSSGSAVTAATEIDYFVYLIWNTTPATDIMDIGFARIPCGRVFSDFSATTTNDRYIATANASAPTSPDDCINIGRFDATLSATASFNWSVPTYTNTNLINRACFYSRRLTFIPAPTGYSSVPTNTSYYYQIHEDQCTVFISEGTNGTSNATTLTMTAPIASATITNGSWSGYGTGVDNGSTLTTPVRVSIASAATTLQFNPNASGTSVWTGSAGKRVIVNQITYGL